MLNELPARFMFKKALGSTIFLAWFAVSLFARQNVSPKAQTLPLDTAHRFVNLESKLLPSQWNELADFFVGTPTPNWNRVHVVDIVDIGVDADSDKADVSISTNSLGILDSSFLLTHYPHARLYRGTNSACYGDDYLGFTLMSSRTGGETSNNGAVRGPGPTYKWKILETSIEPFVTLDTAIRYVEGERNKGANPKMSRNASRTLAILSHYRQGKPLPSNLSFGAGAGCG
jgi:hypothetical protein